MPEKGSTRCALEGGKVVLRRRPKSSSTTADAGPALSSAHRRSALSPHVKTPTTYDVRRLFPQAPEIGSTALVYLGVGKTAGRAHYTVVGGPKDIAREAVVLGYAIRVGFTGPDKAPGVVVTVKLLKRCKLLPKIDTAHVECLLSSDKEAGC